MAPRAAQADPVGSYYGGHLGYKGDEIVNVIINKMPEHKFLVVGEAYYHKFSNFPANLKYCGFQSDMSDFYRQIKVVLIPSLVSEGFSRIIL